MEFKSNSNTRKSLEIESKGIRSKSSLYHISEEKWTSAMVHAAYSEFYDGKCEDELENLENYSPK